MSAALLSTGVVALVPQAASASDSSKASATFGPAQADSEASAALAARLQNRQIEVLDDRTDASQTFANPDGSFSYTVSAAPKWVKRGGVWKTLDATLHKNADGTYSPAQSEVPLTLSGGGSGALAVLTVDGRQTTLTWPNALPTPTVSGATLTYPDVLASGVDLQVTATAAGGIEETLVVKNATAAADPALSDLVQQVNSATGDTVSADAGGNLTVRDASGDLLVNSPAPVMWDSATQTDPGTAAGVSPSPSASVTDPVGDGGTQAAGLEKVAVAHAQAQPGTRSTSRAPGSRAHQGRVKVTYKDHKLHMAADRSLLTAASTVYPVYIDPAFTPHPATGSTLHYDEVQQAYPTTSDYDAAPGSGLAVGYQGFSSPTGIERTYYEISVPATVEGTTVISAKLNTKVTYAATSGSNSTTVGVFSTGPISSSTTWNAQPAKSNSALNPNYPSANNSQTFTTTSTSPNQAVTFDVTSGMQEIANRDATNWTLGLFNATETNDTDLVRFADNPTFSITYNHRPSEPTLVSPAAGASTNDSTPTLSASATDADNDTVRESYQIDKTDGTTLVASGNSAFVNSGASAPWTPTTAIPDGTYEWRASSYDGYNWWSPNSQWTAWRTLTIDTKAPAAPTVSSTDFPAGAWSGTADSGGNFSGAFTFTPPSSDTASVSWSLDGATATTAATTGAAVTKTLTFKAGKHTLAVQTLDAAGNTSSTTSYVFYAGSGAALTSPQAGARPAKRVELDSTGKTSYTGVTYQYRLGETDSWHNVPLADVTKTSDGSAVSAWPVTVANGAPAGLTWNITNSLADGPVDIRALFTDGTTTDGSPATTVTVDRNAGTAPQVDAGPASVNALTGDASLSATDASGFGMSVTRTTSSRRPTLGSSQDGQAAIFGSAWSAGTAADLTDSDWSYVHPTTTGVTTSVSLVDADGDPIGFTATSAGGWKPEPGAEDLTLTGTDSSGKATNVPASTATFTLTESDGTKTTFTKVDPSATAWDVSATYLPTANSTTTVVSQKVTSGSTVLARPQYVIAPTSAVSAAACQAAPSTAGCRVLEYDYATATTATSTTAGDFAGQVTQIREWATAPGASAATATVVAKYDYNPSGQLLDEWDPRISPALKTSYTYDSAGRVATETDPGQLPWTFAYGQVGSSSVAAPGMLLSASRPTLKQGSNTTTDGGTATTSLVYGVPLTGSTAPNAMGPTDVAAWGQTDVPTDATAVFPADQVPASNDGTQLGAGDYGRATITYTDASGRQVNTAVPASGITTTGYDAYGNTVFSLTAANRQLALGSSADQTAEQKNLGIDQDTTAQRAQLLATVSTYNDSPVTADAGTDKDTDPANVGQRELEELGPLHLVTLDSTLKAATGGTDLPAGSVVPAREDTVDTYDQGRPSDGSATTANQITTTAVGAQVAGYPSDGDVQTSTTAYDWAKGLPTQKATDPSGLDLVTTTAYDSQGRVTKTTLPKSNASGGTGNEADATVTTYWSATGTGTCQGHPEWADLVCQTAPAGAITGGGSNPNQAKTTTTTYDQWGNPATVTDTANGVTRTTTNTYDAAGRLTKTTVTGGTGTAVADTTTAYDPATGLKASVTAGGKTITYTYDALGRQTQYTDGNGNGANTAYDADDRPVTVTDAAPSTTTTTYNQAGQAATSTDSVAGTTTAAYDPDGNLYSEKLPGGVDLLVTRDETGQVTGRDYTNDADGSEITGDYAGYDIHGQEVTHNGDAGLDSDQTYTYDADNRLTDVVDTEGSTTTQRAYAFDANTNRTGLTTTVTNPDGTTTGPTTTSYTYDTADRLQTVNGTNTVYDAFGRTTTQADGTQLAYYTDDLAQQETSGTTRTTWTLDPAQRQAMALTESDTSGSWTTTDSTTDHYNSDSDSPDWTTDNTTSAITRYVQDIEGNLAATTSATGDTVLQLTNIHGDAVVQYPLDTTQNPTVQNYDEYGNPINDTATTRYGWLGAKQRSTATPSGLALMGARLYNPATGRFLQTDPVPGGSDDAYEYCGGNPINQFDLNGQWWHWVRKTWHFVKRHRVGIAAVTAGFACGVWSAGIAGGACAVIAGGLAGGAAKWAGNRRASRHAIGYAALNGADTYGPMGFALGAAGGAGWRKFYRPRLRFERIPYSWL